MTGRKTIANAPSGEDTSLDGTEKFPVSGSKYALISSIAAYIRTLTQTLTGKTINLTDNTLTGTKAQFNTAMSDADFATLTGSETLTNKTLTAPTIADFTNAAHDHGDADDGGTIAESVIAFTDITTNNSSTTKHGYLKKLDNDNTHFMDGTGAWAVPSVAAAVATDAIWDAKGDLAVGTGANTAAKLTVGTNGQVLTADSAEVTGTKWSTVAGTGDFVGPGASTDNAVVRFDSTTGKLGQNSVMTVDDSGTVNIPTGQTYNINGTAHTHAGSGGLVLLEQHTASASASLDFTTGITATYDEYIVELLNLIPATNAVDLYMRVSTDGGSSYDSGSNYAMTVFGHDHSGSAVAGQTPGTATTAFKFRNAAEISNSANYGVCGDVKLFSPGSAIYKRVIHRVSYLNSSSNLSNVIGEGAYLSATAVNAFQFLFSSGNITSGIARLYGIVKS